ncbi:hypothetical protein ACTQZS_14630 [Bilifractor sp. LCP19S3_H10]|uniref:hypothetical protein n=1 Tax=Bilifractor sp. LCP19S3_H10 TaxID=3438736 RepID=UPI003F934E20
MYDRTISLPEKVEVTRDSEGYRKETIVWASGIPASRRDATRNDEIIAQQDGYTADVVFRIASICYSGEKYLKDDADDHIYDIKRHYHGDKRMYVDLTCQRRERDG